jgi:hypothetical protein
MDSPKNLAHRFEIGDITFFGTTGNFVQPAHRFGFQTGFGWIARGINHFDFHFHGILTPADPAFSLFTSFFHIPTPQDKLLPAWLDSFRSTTTRSLQPPYHPQGFVERPPKDSVAPGPLPQQFRIPKPGNQLPRCDLTLFTALIRMPGNEEPILFYG